MSTIVRASSSNVVEEESLLVSLPSVSALARLFNSACLNFFSCQSRIALQTTVAAATRNVIQQKAAEALAELH